MKIFKIQITDRKKQVAKLYVEGKTFKEISQILDPPISDVRVYKMWNDMLKYCIAINNWPQKIKLLKKKEFMEVYGKSMLLTLGCYRNH